MKRPSRCLKLEREIRPILRGRNGLRGAERRDANALWRSDRYAPLRQQRDQAIKHVMLTDRLVLRRPVASDAHAHFAIHGDPATNVYNPAGPLTDLVESVEIIEEWSTHWELAGYGYWAVSLGDDIANVIGFGGVAMKPLAGIMRLNLYFRLSPSVWGKGFATELGKCALHHASKVARGREVYALVRPDNAPSISVIRKLEMVPVGEIDDVPGSESSLLFATAST